MTLHPLLKRLAALVSGAALGNLIVLAATPLLTRLYGPGDFGLLATFASVSGILGAVFCLRYEQAVYVPRSERTALLLAAGGLLSALLFMVLFTGIAALVFWFSEAGTLGAWWLAVPLAGALLAVYNLLSNWAVRRNQVGRVVRTRLSRAVVQVAVQGGAGVAGLVPGGLMAGDLGGRFAGVWGLGRLYASACRSGLLSLKRVWVAMRRYRRFPFLAAPGALVNVMVMQGAPVVLAFGYSPSAAGIYFLVQRLMAAPLALVGQSVAQVFTAEFGQRLGRHAGGYLPLYLRAVGGLLLFGGVPISLIGIYGGNILPTLFGPEWSQADRYLLALTPFFVGQFVMSPLANLLNTLERQEILLGWDVARLTLALPSLILPGLYGYSAEQALWVYSSVMAMFYVALFIILVFVILRRSRA